MELCYFFFCCCCSEILFEIAVNYIILKEKSSEALYMRCRFQSRYSTSTQRGHSCVLSTRTRGRGWIVKSGGGIFLFFFTFLFSLSVFFLFFFSFTRIQRTRCHPTCARGLFSIYIRIYRCLACRGDKWKGLPKTNICVTLRWHKCHWLWVIRDWRKQVRLSRKK